MKEKPNITPHESTSIPRRDQRALKRGMKKLALEENARCDGAVGWGIHLTGGRPADKGAIYQTRRVLSKTPMTAIEVGKRIEMAPQTAQRALRSLYQSGEAVPDKSSRTWTWTAV